MTAGSSVAPPRRRMGPRLAALSVAFAACAAAASALDAQRVMLTGVVRSTDAEPIHVPMSNTSPVVLRQLAVEGSTVKPGDLLVRIDPGAVTAQIGWLKSQLTLARARIDKERAELDVKRVDAALALVDAEAALATAEIDAAIPSIHIARIDYDRFQGEAERARRELVLKRKELANAEEAMQRRERDGALEIASLEADLAFAERQIQRAEQRATRAGTVIFGFHPWTGQRFEAGASGNPGMQIGEVVGPGELAVRAWAHEVDRPGLRVGQVVEVRFDAIPGRRTVGRIVAIAGAPEPKAEWGAGRYFTLDLSLDAAAAALPLRPGMSVRIDVDTAADIAVAAAAGAVK